MGVLAAKLALCVPHELDCAHAIRASTNGMAALVCEREFARTQDPVTGARLASMLRRSGNLDAAAAIATGLLATDARADAMQVLAKIAIAQQRLDDARQLLVRARALHAVGRDPGRTALDDKTLAEIYERQDKYVEALLALDSCIVEARKARDDVLEGYCHLSAGSVLGKAGYFEGAQDELARAESLLTTDRDLAQLTFQRAGLAQRYGLGIHHRNYNMQAVAQLERTLVHARRAELPIMARAAELNLAYSLAELKQIDEARRHLDIAQSLDINNEDALERDLLAARIAYRRGDHLVASTIHNRIYDQLDAKRDRLAVAVIEGRIALAARDHVRAATWARRGVEAAEEVRAAQTAIELRSWALSARRESHEILFVALARAGRFEDALVAFDGWQGRALLDALARDRSMPPGELQAAAMRTGILQRLFPVLSHAPIVKPIDRGVLLASLAAVDLIALVIAEGELWRIAARTGRIEVISVGSIATLEPQLDKFRSTPTEPSFGDALGVLLLGAEAFRPVARPLHVLLDGPLATLPVAALRSANRFLIETRTLVRAARLSETGCVRSLAHPRRTVVIANARGDLVAAEAEAREIARRFGVVAATGVAATRAALVGAAQADLLHVAVHADIIAGVGSMALHDEAVSAVEIASHPGGPALVVLASCSSGNSDDGELSTSLATAFLASGSKQVIGTLRPVSDRGARQLTSAGYRDDGPADPAAVLARSRSRSRPPTTRTGPTSCCTGRYNARPTPP
ncbi:MAG: CHAT domain-containing protein [Kofleriaceae bacterium]